MIKNDILKEDAVMEIGRKKAMTAIFSVVLIAMSVYSVFVWIDIYSEKRFPESTLEFIAASCFPFFLIGGIFSIKKIIDKRPAVILSPKGISNYSNIAACDLIKWNEIERFEFRNTKGAGMICIFVKDPDFFIRHSSGIALLYMKMGNRASGTPFAISTDILDCNVNDLMEALNYRLQKYRHTI